MNLRNKLYKQSMQVLVITVIITVLLSLVFGFIYTKIFNIPMDHSRREAHDIVLKNDVVIYKPSHFDDYDIQSVMLSIKLREKQISMEGKTYDLAVSNFSEGKDNYRMIELYNYVNMSTFYRVMICFVICVFIIVFLIAICVMHRKNKKQLIDPIVHLKRSTEALTAGNLDQPIYDEGYGEVQDLSIAIEKLRLTLKETVLQQEKSEDNRKFLMSSISHDLKTPVTAIRGYVEGVLDGVANIPEKREHYLKKAVDKTILMSHMIEDLLLYTKLDLNQIPFQFTRVDIVSFMQSAVDDNLLAYQQEDKALILKNELDEIFYVSIDPQRFQRVVQNILDNARKHTDEHDGRMTVTIRPSGVGVVMEFADNGEGIKKEDLNHIFERFYRADSARKVEGSSGLGLAIARQLVSGMNGRIWAVSEEEKGTNIMVSFPRAHGITAPSNQKSGDRV